MTRYASQLLAGHDCRTFRSGTHSLDRYLRECAANDMRMRIASCFVAVDGLGMVVGYYTLTARLLAFERPAVHPKNSPLDGPVSAILLRRLGVDREDADDRLAAALVVDALLRASRTGTGVRAMLVDTKDEAAAKFYEYLGFEPLPSNGRRLIRPL